MQVTKDPIGHKGARLTSQISLAGRFLVYVPDGTTSGISRKLPDTERNRLKTLLKEIVPDTAGVIVRTAAEGASEDELTRDVERLKARWEDIEKKAKGSAPQLLYGEPDLTLKVVRDLFTEDFAKLVIQGDDAWETVQGYVAHVAPDLAERLERYRPEEHGGRDVFAAYRIDEQIAKGLDRKVWLPSGGSLVIDRTEAMTVVDVNTGKFTGSGRQPRGDGHQEQPRGGRGDRPPAPAARHRRHHRRRLHRHGARVQPRPGAAPPGRVPGPRPHPPPGRRGHLARPGADDPQADRHRPARGVQRDLRALPGPRRRHPRHARRAEAVRRRRPAEAARGRRSRGGRRPRRPVRRRRRGDNGNGHGAKAPVAQGRRRDGQAAGRRARSTRARRAPESTTVDERRPRSTRSRRRAVETTTVEEPRPRRSSEALDDRDEPSEESPPSPSRSPSPSPSRSRSPTRRPSRRSPRSSPAPAAAAPAARPGRRPCRRVAEAPAIGAGARCDRAPAPTGSSSRARTDPSADRSLRTSSTCRSSGRAPASAEP